MVFDNSSLYPTDSDNNKKNEEQSKNKNHCNQ